MRYAVTDRRETRRPRLARALFWAALIMLAVSLYEIGVRLSDLSGELRMVSRMVGDGRLTWGDFLTRYMWDLNSFSVAGYMGLRALLSLWAMAARCERRACVWMVVPAGMLTALGFTLRTGPFSGMFRALSMAPLLLFTALCALHVCLRPRRSLGHGPRPAPLQDGRPMR